MLLTTPEVAAILRVSPATVLGHVSAALTTDTYASSTDEGLRRAADAVEEALG